MTNKQRERDYAVMRDMGCNAVRMAHYQHASEEYALCDKLGMCVWTEIGIIGKLCPGAVSFFSLLLDYYKYMGYNKSRSCFYSTARIITPLKYK